jgi:hypothetical protein
MIPDNYLLDDKQNEAVWHLRESSNAIVWWKIGEGKSRIAIYWSYWITKGNPRPLIVCSPEAMRTWQDEIDLLQLERYKPMFFSFGMLTKGSKGVWELNRQLNLRRFDPNCAIIDELWLYKNPKSKRSGAILGISRAYPTIGLSGSMITAGNVEDLYGQAKAVGLGESIATSLTNFRSQFCISVQGYGSHLNRYPRKGAVETIQKRIKDSVHIWFPKDRVEAREIPTKFDPSPQQEKIANDLIKEYYVKTQQGFELEVKSKASLIIKLLQVSDGFLRSGEGSYISIKSNKLQGLIHNISELLESGERVLVWFAFKKSIKEAVSLSTFPTVVLSGDEKFDSEAWRRGKVNVCYATVGSGASLNDFKDVRYAIIYSSSFSFRALEQAKGRTARKSSGHSIAYYYFYQTVGFPEQYIYETIDMSENTEQTTIKVTNKVLDNWLREKAIWDSL